MKDNDNDDEEQTTQQQQGWFGTIGRQFGHQGPFMRGQFGQRGWLRPAILRLLQEKPMSGMEIINRFYETSHGWFKPSPGSVYPLLENLESEGMVKRMADGRYQVTEKFISETRMPTGQVEEMIANMEGTISYFEDMAKSDKKKFSSYKSRLEKLSQRISKIK